MTHELIIGIDLGLKHPHRAAIMDADNRCNIGKSFTFDRSIDGFNKLLDRCDKVKDNHQLVFVMEPTSMAWLPLSCFLMGKGHRVYVVKTQKVSKLREFFGLNKSDRLDAQTLSRVYHAQPDTLKQLFIPPASIKTIDRFCRQRARLVQRTSAIRKRIWHLFTFANPKAIDAFGRLNFTGQCRAFLRNYIDPHKIVDAGLKNVTDFLAKYTNGALDPEVPHRLMQASESTVEIYKEYQHQNGLPFDPEALQMEVNIELDILEAYEEKIKTLDKEILKCYLAADPKRHLQSLRGIADILAPIIYAVVGDIRRFQNLRSFKGFLSMVPKKKQTTDNDRKGLRIQKASFWLLKHSFYMAAEVARHWDPEIAEFYHRLMKRGKHHDQAVCACANKLAGRVYAVLKRMADPNCPDEKVPYVLRDLNGNPVDKKTAKAIIDAGFSESRTHVQPESVLAFNLNALMNASKTRDNSPHKVKSMEQILKEMLETALAEINNK